MNSIIGGRRPSGYALSLIVLIQSAAAVCSAATITRGPYLQQGTPTSVVVRWRTDVATGSAVGYGTNSGNFSSTVNEATLTTEHVVMLTNLQPGTKYFYELGTGSTWFTGDTNDFFMTSPPVGSKGPTRIWALGDSGTASTEAAAVRDAYTIYRGERPTDVWLMLGDNAYSSGTDAEYQTAVYDFYPTYLQNTVLWPTIGNHDASSSNAYLPMFTLPQNAEAGGVASGTKHYYSFDYANIHFICLDSALSDRTTNGAMYQWLRADLEATAQDWLIAFWHHPPYSKGNHDSDADPTMTEMRQNIVPMLEDFGVDLVLCGHSHVYERSFLLDGHYGVSTTFSSSMKIDGGDGREDGYGAYRKPAGINSHHGAVYTVAGSSGKTSSGPLNHPAMHVSMEVEGSVVIDVNGSRLDMAFLQTNVTTGDHFTILKSPPPTNAPAAPTNLSAVAVFSSEIDLSWTDNADNEQGFEVERSANGVDFVPVASVRANATNWADTGLSPGTTGYYRVRAYNVIGDSPYSSVASASTLVGDFSPPAAVTNLTVSGLTSNSVTLSWTAPGNDGHVGTAARYEVRYSTALITTGNWASALQASGAPAPAPAGTSQLFTINGLASGITYYFALETYDETNNVSPLSNVPSAATALPGERDTTPPAAVLNLAVGTVTSNSVTLSWTAPGDDGNVGTAASYDVRYSASLITTSNWASATQATGEPAPAIAGTLQSFKVNSLAAGQTYYFALKTSDETNNLSPLSNVAAATTLLPSTGGTGSVVILIPSNSVWKYLDTGTNLGTAWRTRTFDDSAWPSGPAQLGYGSGREATVLSYGSNANNKYLTTYFRRHFTVPDPSTLADLRLAVQRDDGVVAYLNGTEIFRDNMPTGAVDYLTVALTSVSGTNETYFFPSPALDLDDLISGDNVLAAEIHQRSHSSSDIAFNLELKADLSQAGVTPPLVRIALSTNRNVTLRWNSSPGKQYRLQYVTNVSSTVWTTLGSDIIAAGSSVSATDSTNGGRQRFYRVIALP